MKAVTAAWIALAATIAQGQAVRMKVLIGGKPAGAAVCSLKFLPDGSIETGLDMTFNVSGVETSASSRFITDKRGRPRMQSIRQSAPGFSDFRKVMYGKDSITVIKELQSRVTSEKLPIPRGARIASESNVWFALVTPAKGAADTSSLYDLQRSKWISKTTRYEGAQDITFKGKKVRAHRVVDGAGTFFVDEKGLPYRLTFTEQGIRFVIERS